MAAKTLESLYCMVWLDAMFYKVKEEGRTQNVVYFKYPEGIRKLIYTTNTIEGYHPADEKSN